MSRKLMNKKKKTKLKIATSSIPIIPTQYFAKRRGKKDIIIIPYEKKNQKQQIKLCLIQPNTNIIICMIVAECVW